MAFGSQWKTSWRPEMENSAFKLLSDIVDCVVCFLITEFMDSVFLNVYAISSEDWV